MGGSYRIFKEENSSVIWVSGISGESVCMFRVGFLGIRGWLGVLLGQRD